MLPKQKLKIQPIQLPTLITLRYSTLVERKLTFWKVLTTLTILFHTHYITLNGSMGLYPLKGVAHAQKEVNMRQSNCLAKSNNFKNQRIDFIAKKPNSTILRMKTRQSETSE